MVTLDLPKYNGAEATNKESTFDQKIGRSNTHTTTEYWRHYYDHQLVHPEDEAVDGGRGSFPLRFVREKGRLEGHAGRDPEVAVRDAGQGRQLPSSVRREGLLVHRAGSSAQSAAREDGGDERPFEPLAPFLGNPRE